MAEDAIASGHSALVLLCHKMAILADPLAAWAAVEFSGSVADFLALAGWGIVVAGLVISGAAGVG
jgi:hypothetical protein